MGTRSEDLKFGRTLILERQHNEAIERARACFEAMPQLDSLAIWTKPSDGDTTRCRLMHDHTWFWTDRTEDQGDLPITLEDLADDRAAAACMRFSFAHDNAAHHLAADAGLDDLVCVLIFHRSGHTYLVRDAERLFEMPQDRLLGLGMAHVAAFIHPVFAEEPTGHQEIAWIDAVWADLDELQFSAE